MDDVFSILIRRGIRDEDNKDIREGLLRALEIYEDSEYYNLNDLEDEEYEEDKEDEG